MSVAHSKGSGAATSPHLHISVPLVSSFAGGLECSACGKSAGRPPQELGYLLIPGFLFDSLSAETLPCLGVLVKGGCRCDKLVFSPSGILLNAKN